MKPNDCFCQMDDCVAAEAVIRRASSQADTDMLIEESHFMASLVRCTRPLCGQWFLKMFCECVDWADSDDPQVSIAALVSDEEAAALRAARTGITEEILLALLPGERRFLIHNMPKGAPETREWRVGTLFVPAHD